MGSRQFAVGRIIIVWSRTYEGYPSCGLESDQFLHSDQSIDYNPAAFFLLKTAN
jgi:hypothetical protein